MVSNTKTQVCSSCGVEKTIDCYHRDKDRLVRRCKSCRYECAKKWRAANRERVRRVQNWNYVKRRFGLSEADYNDMLVKQGGGCAVCGGQNGTRRLAVDHCHKSGRVRGLLCLGCNTGLGKFRDSLPAMQKAMEYLRKHGATWS